MQHVAFKRVDVKCSMNDKDVPTVLVHTIPVINGRYMLPVSIETMDLIIRMHFSDSHNIPGLYTRESATSY